jgi:hypothetical protein
MNHTIRFAPTGPPATLHQHTENALLTLVAAISVLAMCWVSTHDEAVSTMIDEALVVTGLREPDPTLTDDEAMFCAAAIEGRLCDVAPGAHRELETRSVWQWRGFSEPGPT